MIESSMHTAQYTQLVVFCGNLFQFHSNSVRNAHAIQSTTINVLHFLTVVVLDVRRCQRCQRTIFHCILYDSINFHTTKTEKEEEKRATRMRIKAMDAKVKAQYCISISRSLYLSCEYKIYIFIRANFHLQCKCNNKDCTHEIKNVLPLASCAVCFKIFVNNFKKNLPSFS